MKKFLSLVLALVMTMSLVTISAGATEYKDLTDKGEIKYEEAVAVLNKIGIITGYEDGSFKPTNNLTRGAAAKIIVSLMIGPEAASSLTVNANPYKDVKATDTFAPYIAYCKTAGYISGYSDGSFRAGDPLTGYAFSKMLLGALGYKSNIEGFTGSGWTMNVARLANKAGLLNDIVSFSGNTAVTREVACQLSLNTLKATNVEYAGTDVSVKGDGIDVTVGNTAYSYVISNNTKINTNIGTTYTISGVKATEQTLEFGEEHFADLRLERGDFTDSFGRPSNKWSFKNVAVGTYALTPDYTYSKGAAGDTAADKVKDMGLKGFKFVDSDSAVGVQFTVNVNGDNLTFGEAGDNLVGVNTDATILEFIANNITGKGVQVEVYLQDGSADTIQSVVVVYTQMMQVNSVKSNEVTLKNLDDAAGTIYMDYNDNDVVDAGDTTIYSVHGVAAVKSDDSNYKALKDLKADDYVLVVPYLDGSWKVASVAVPQSVTGKLSNIKVNARNNTVTAVTVGGTAYDMSKLWSAEGDNLKADTKISTTKDTTIYLDSFGYTIYAKDVVASNSTIIIDEIYNSDVDGRLVKKAIGWDYNGNAVTLNLGTKSLPQNDNYYQGKTFEYKTATTNNADYTLVSEADGTLVGSVNGFIAAGASKLNNIYFDSSVKFVFLAKDTDDTSDVTGITVREGVTEVGKVDKTYDLTYILNKDGDKIVAVIVPNDDDAANTANLLFFQKVTNHINNKDGKRVAVFTAYIDGEKMTDLELNKDVRDADYNGKFFTYSKDETTGVYTLSGYDKTTKATSVVSNTTLAVGPIVNKTYINLDGAVSELNAKNAKVIDLYTDDGKDYSSLKEIAESGLTGFTVSAIYNGNSDISGYKTVSHIFITGNISGPIATKYNVDDTTDKVLFSLDGTTWNSTVRAASGATVYVKPADSTLDIQGVQFPTGTALTADANGLYPFTMGAADVSAASTVIGFKATDLYHNTTTGKLMFATVSVGGGTAPSGVAKAALTKTFLENAGYTSVTYNATGDVTFTAPSGITYTVATGNIDMTATNVAIKVNGNTQVVTAATTIATVTGIEATAYCKLSDGTYQLVGATAVTAGKNYGTTAYYKVSMAALSKTVAGVTFTAPAVTGEYVTLANGLSFTLTATVAPGGATAAGTATVTCVGATITSAVVTANAGITAAAGVFTTAANADVTTGTYTVTVKPAAGTADWTVTLA